GAAGPRWLGSRPPRVVGSGGRGIVLNRGAGSHRIGAPVDRPGPPAGGCLGRASSDRPGVPMRVFAPKPTPAPGPEVTSRLLRNGPSLGLRPMSPSRAVGRSGAVRPLAKPAPHVG